MSDATPEMQKAAIEWRAQGFVDEQKAAKPLQAFEAAQNPPPAESAAFGHDDLAKLLWVAASILGSKFAGPKYELTATEQSQLAQATVPVLVKYLPVDMLSTGPEIALLVVASAVYGPKLMAPDAPAAVPTEATP